MLIEEAMQVNCVRWRTGTRFAAAVFATDADARFGKRSGAVMLRSPYRLANEGGWNRWGQRVVLAVLGQHDL
jgi:hypothetical protein